MLWQLNIHCWSSGSADNRIRLAIGDQQPTSEAQMSLLQPLINGLGSQGSGPRRIKLLGSGVNMRVDMRTVIASRGRGLILEVYSVAEQIIGVHVITVVSSIPKEVPDWLISGRAGGR